jgi:hypothetical protein
MGLNLGCERSRDILHAAETMLTPTSWTTLANNQERPQARRQAQSAA